MRDRIARTIRTAKELVRVELTVSYSSVLLIGLFVIISILTGLATIYEAHSPILFNRDLNAPFNGPNDVQLYLGVFSEVREYALIYSFRVTSAALSFLMPLVISFGLSKFFEDGTMRTLLSYPVSRTQYLMTKSSILLAISFLFPLISSLFWIFLWFPYGTGIQGLSILVLAQFASISFIVASLILISVIFRHVSTSAIVGLSMWGTLAYATMYLTDILPIWLIQVTNPIRTAELFLIGYEFDLVLTDVVLSIAAAFGLSLLCLFLAVAIFKRTEV